MSRFSEDRPDENVGSGPVKQIITPKEKDLGGFTVRRVLPAASQRMVGPFIFFDHIGPAIFPPGEGIQVRPHPHIGLATVTYLFDGQLVHRDSLGSKQVIRPGAVNWMIAGRGIVHSERAGDDLNENARLHGIQIWVALPEDEQECDPVFVHYPASDIPEVTISGVSVQVIIGDAFGYHSPVATLSETVYLSCTMNSGSTLKLPVDCEQMALYPVTGDVRVGKQTIRAGSMAILGNATELEIGALGECHLLVIGGTPLGDRHLWWNFVSSSPQRIELAKSDWREGRFAKVPDDEEFIPLPE